MAPLQIKIYGDDCLKRISKPVETFDGDLKRLIGNMAETMYEARGIGLAAPQVGENVRLLILDVDWIDEEGGEPKEERNLKVLVNPALAWESVEDSSVMEGCLSLPGIEGEVYRPVAAEIRYQDESGQQHERRVEGMEARCVQHEIDHLDGVLFVDRMPRMRRRLLAGKLNALKKTPRSDTNVSAQGKAF
ncbi:MAG TPA: peptide deformylase [Sumerlaeia bacterium]|nr:peptide deformylase [Sumerlaeia bacterium]